MRFEREDTTRAEPSQTHRPLARFGRKDGGRTRQAPGRFGATPWKDQRQPTVERTPGQRLELSGSNTVREVAQYAFPNSTAGTVFKTIRMSLQVST